MANTRKVVLFIVEGPSDEAALGGIFTKIFNNAAVKFDVIHGDVTHIVPRPCQDTGARAQRDIETSGAGPWLRMERPGTHSGYMRYGRRVRAF